MIRPLAAALLLLAACHGGNTPTAPYTDVTTQPHGVLSGTVTIGPNCPVEKPDQPCPTPPAAYAARKVLVYDSPKQHLLNTLDIDASGHYSVLLVPAFYTVDLKGSGIDRSADVPKTISIHEGQTTVVDIHIDTGLR